MTDYRIPDYRIVDVKLDERTIIWRNADVEQERRVAIFDLLEGNSFKPLMVPAWLGWPFGIFLLRQYFMGLPGELMDAARIDGAGFFTIYARIMLPLTTPALSALGVFTFMGSWNSFYGPLLFLRSWNKYTLPIALVLLR